MSDRAILFLFSVLVVIASLVAASWLLVTGQAGTVDGLFLFLTCLVIAFAFALYIAFMIRRAMESLQQPAPAAKPVAKSTAAAQPAKPSKPAEVAQS